MAGNAGLQEVLVPADLPPYVPLGCTLRTMRQPHWPQMKILPVSASLCAIIPQPSHVACMKGGTPQDDEQEWMKAKPRAVQCIQ